MTTEQLNEIVKRQDYQEMLMWFYELDKINDSGRYILSRELRKAAKYNA